LVMVFTRFTGSAERGSLKAKPKKNNAFEQWWLGGKPKSPTASHAIRFQAMPGYLGGGAHDRNWTDLAGQAREWWDLDPACAEGGRLFAGGKGQMETSNQEGRRWGLLGKNRPTMSH